MNERKQNMNEEEEGEEDVKEGKKIRSRHCLKSKISFRGRAPSS